MCWDISNAAILNAFWGGELAAFLLLFFLFGECMHTSHKVSCSLASCTMLFWLVMHIQWTTHFADDPRYFRSAHVNLVANRESSSLSSVYSGNTYRHLSRPASTQAITLGKGIANITRNRLNHSGHVGPGNRVSEAKNQRRK